MDEWTKNIKPEDITSENMRLIAEQCGVEVALSLMDKMAGVVLYVPAKNTGLKKLMHDYIRKKYDGTRDSTNRLALETGISVNKIHRIVTGKDDEDLLCKGQTTFLDQL